MPVTIARDQARVTIRGGVFEDVVGFDRRTLDWLADLWGGDSPSMGDADLLLAQYLCSKLKGAQIVHHEPPPYTPGAVY